MERLVLVFIGGGVGAVARHFTGQLALRAFGPAWPYGTFAVNVIGGLLMGVLAGWLAHRGGENQMRWALLLGVGVLGGFTTFSAFSLETVSMLQKKAYVSGGVYVVSSVLLSVAALWLGLSLSRRIFA
jgi:CrcB protein